MSRVAAPGLSGTCPAPANAADGTQASHRDPRVRSRGADRPCPTLEITASNDPDRAIMSAGIRAGRKATTP